jgi:hypothetical protein
LNLRMSPSSAPMASSGAEARAIAKLRALSQFLTA